MKRAALVLLGVVVVVYVVAIFIPFDPLEQRPGTRLSGALAADQQTDFAHLQGRNQIFVETRTWYLIPHSVTTTSWAADGAFYVPCGSCDKKRWPKNVQRDPRVRLKVNGELYERTAVRITDPDRRRAVLGIAPGEQLPDMAVFRMDPHS